MRYARHSATLPFVGREEAFLPDDAAPMRAAIDWENRLAVKQKQLSGEIIVQGLGLGAPRAGPAAVAQRESPPPPAAVPAPVVPAAAPKLDTKPENPLEVISELGATAPPLPARAKRGQ